MDHDASSNHAVRRRVLASWRRVASAVAPPATGQGASSAQVSYFNATVTAAETTSHLYQVTHVSGEVYRGVPAMAHAESGGTIANGTVVSVRKVGSRLVIDGVPLGNADSFVG